MASLELRGISFAYRLRDEQLPVLKSLDVHVRDGEMVAIQGPSGSGKSTLLYLIAGLLRPTRGSVRLDGVDLGALSDDELARVRNRRIAFIFQQFHLLPKATVLENILLPASYPSEVRFKLKERVVQATEIARSLGLGDRLSHLPNELSGGQQQRVAIARALMNGADLILADEPTGSLDSHSAEQVFQWLRQINRDGRTVILITHDPVLAARCDRVLHIKDGTISDPIRPMEYPEDAKDFPTSAAERSTTGLRAFTRLLFNLIPVARRNVARDPLRSLLTMTGVAVGVAAVLAMVTLGDFAKRRILDSYADLGVNTLMFAGYPNWDLPPTEQVSTPFRFFDWERDLVPLKRVFPQITGVSPVMMNWRESASFGGRQIESEIQPVGLGAEGIEITHRKILVGHGISEYHIAQRSSVCVIGFEVARRLFATVNPLGQVLQISGNNTAYGCRVIGVFVHRSSNSEWMKPDLQVALPYTYSQVVVGDWWNAQIKDVVLSVDPSADIERTGAQIRSYFERRYGKSGTFRVDSDSVLLGQMKRFLSIFSLFLAAVAFIALAVGGIGITNLMYASISERLREIGLRKALGATNRSIQLQFMLEAIVTCTAAGILGIGLGFVCYQLVILGAAQFITKLKYEWIFDPTAMFISLVAIMAVGILSGYIPALKAKKLEVMEALRSE